MDMNTQTTSTMSMAMTSAAAAPAASASGMGMSMGGGSSCKISMLWNWYTIDACFLSSQWRVTSAGMMAGSCIGVILLVMVLEGLRRASREYDAFIVRQHSSTTASPMPIRGNSDSDSDNKNPMVPSSAAVPLTSRPIKPTLLQQLVRASLHMLQFAVAYFVMLLAMYFNGYIIISILIGAFLGAFIFSWHSLGNAASGSNDRELTYCCG